MKTTLLFVFLFLALFQVRGQDHNLEVPTIEYHGKVDVKAENSYLMRRLLLNQSQFEKIANINTERNQLLEMVAAMYQHDPENYSKKALELELQFDAEFEKVLTGQQFSEYLAMHGRSPKKEELSEAEEVNLAEKTEETPKPAELSFNDRLHAFIEKATAVKIDSSLIARQDTTDFEPLTMEEESILNGLMPQNATLIAIRTDTVNKKTADLIATRTNTAGKKNVDLIATRTDTAGKKNADLIATRADTTIKKNADLIATRTDTSSNNNATIAKTGLKPDGECKTCYSVNTEDSTAIRSKLISMKMPKRPANKINAEETWSSPDATYGDANSGYELQETGSGNEKNPDEKVKPAAIEEQPAEEQEQGILIEENASGQVNTHKTENSLEIPANEVKKLRESMQQHSENGTENEEKTASEESTVPPVNKSLPLNKSLAGEMEP